MKVLTSEEKEILEKRYIGVRIYINSMLGEPHYNGREGIVKFVDDIGQLHGTWGGCAVIPGKDTFTRLKDDE